MDLSKACWSEDSTVLIIEPLLGIDFTFFLSNMGIYFDKAVLDEKLRFPYPVVAFLFNLHFLLDKVIFLIE